MHLLSYFYSVFWLFELCKVCSKTENLVSLTKYSSLFKLLTESDYSSQNRKISTCINDIECSETFRREFKRANDSVWKILSDLHEELSRNSIRLTAFGMFTLNYEFFGYIVTGILSYQIILLQFFIDNRKK